MNVGQTLASGIQDISAFLPIIGTDQCERHIGDALEGGYLYAAAAPLSMFGCLGIVKASLAIFFASIDGGRILRNAGFELQGAAAAMIGATEKRSLSSKTVEYVAETQFKAALTEQNVIKSKLLPEYEYRAWNIHLLTSTVGLSSLSIAPYIAIIDNPESSFTAWRYPFLRIAGSAICAVTAQLMLQTLIRRIVSVQQILGEQDTNRNDPELSIFDIRRYRLFIYRILLVVGSIATAVGYIGCFTVVQNSSHVQTLLWVALEGWLSLVRLFLWGWNPSWDNGTYIRLQIHTGDYISASTTDMEYEDLMDKHIQFTSVLDCDFLHLMMAHTGPIARLNDPDHHTVIFYATARSRRDGKKIRLLTTVVDLKTGSTFVLVHAESANRTWHTLTYPAAITVTPVSGVVNTQLRGDSAINRVPNALLNSERFLRIYAYSQALVDRFDDRELRVSRLHLSWTGKFLESSSIASPEIDNPAAPLFRHPYLNDS
ncbi:hypothetical protein C8R45DRAFT_1041465 [Mycena sanguinolenta]|nr:hypothetical protein C8R45DRAFT_1041465 [Mycena sanguinolenta]